VSVCSIQFQSQPGTFIFFVCRNICVLDYADFLASFLDACWVIAFNLSLEYICQVRVLRSSG